MLKWTVKKRSDLPDSDSHASQIYPYDDEQHYSRVYKSVHARRSLGNVLSHQQLQNQNSPAVDLKFHKRRSLGSQFSHNRVRFDKENHLTSTPNQKRTMSHSCSLNKVNVTPLNDCSNLQRKTSFTSTKKRKRQLVPSTLPASPLATLKSNNANNVNKIYVDQQHNMMAPLYAPTLPSFDIEYSPLLKTADQLSTVKNLTVADTFYDNPLYFTGPAATPCINYDELPTKRQKTNFQDLSYEFKPEARAASSPFMQNESTPLTSRKILSQPVMLDNSITNSSFTGSSFNSSEVGDVTLEKMIDAILASAKHGKKFRKHQKHINNNCNNRNFNFVKNMNRLSNIEEPIVEEKSIPNKLERIIILSPGKDTGDRTIILTDKIGCTNEREVKSPVSCDPECTENELLATDTCLLKRQKAVRRKNTSNENKNKKKLDESKSEHFSTQKCLTFSPSNDDELMDKFKRSSVSSNSSTSSMNSLTRYAKNVLLKGSLELAITTDDTKNKIIVHVIKCKNLQRPNENLVNAYVKCALMFGNSSQQQTNPYQRTAVHRNSTSPQFDHKFLFTLDDCSDYTKRIQLAVWHRNRELKRSEFLGCLSISVKSVMEKNMQGTFLLQPQICLTNPTPIIPELDENHCESEDSIAEKSKTEDMLMRFLELDHIPSNSNPLGRTPFTLTKTISREFNESFGFTISWTQPPRIEKIEPNLPAEMCGILPGDYIIFVGHFNIVTMSEMDILDLIVKQGNELILEIFRPTKQMTSHCIIEQLASLSTPKSMKNCSLPQNEDLRKAALTNSIGETPKRRYNVPKIAFVEDVGKGVIV